ncbi:MAG: Nramp family divalent metal transporter [Candidatus Aenigmarchaeota archaeon]|nr:Nramp family divalent metal transporter [Candidatus Aenigmarchaeota archaeon]
MKKKPSMDDIKKTMKKIKEDLEQTYITYKYKTVPSLNKAKNASEDALKKGFETSKHVGEEINKKYVKKAGDYWEKLGPGLTTGAADDDPSGIATYSQTGTKYGFQLLWLAIFTFPFMSLVQEMCARIGLVTGKGLAANIRENFPIQIIYLSTFFLLVANVFNLGVDLGMMARSTQLIFPQIDFTVLLIMFTTVSLGFQVFTTYPQYAKYLKYLALILFSYVISVLVMKDLNWSQILSSAITPAITFSKDQIILICGILGTTISPYLFFWQTSQEVEELHTEKGDYNVRARQHGIQYEGLNSEIKKMRIDVWSGMFISNLVMFFIIVATAATLFSNGITNINTVQDAATALRPIAGEQAYLLFTIGVVGAGLLAVPILAGSASYALSESLKIKGGLNYKLKDAPLFYGIIIASMVIGFAINFLGIDPINALIYSAIINGLISPLILFIIVKISSDHHIMGNKVNHPLVTLLGWAITGLMTVVGIITVASFFL